MQVLTSPCIVVHCSVINLASALAYRLALDVYALGRCLLSAAALSAEAVLAQTAIVSGTWTAREPDRVWNVP